MTAPGDAAAVRALAAGVARFAAGRGLAVSAADVLDVLWLAAHLPAGGRFRAETAPTPPAPSPPPPPLPLPPAPAV